MHLTQLKITKVNCNFFIKCQQESRLTKVWITKFGSKIVRPVFILMSRPFRFLLLFHCSFSELSIDLWNLSLVGTQHSWNEGRFRRSIDAKYSLAVNIAKLLCHWLKDLQKVENSIKAFTTMCRNARRKPNGFYFKWNMIQNSSISFGF